MTAPLARNLNYQLLWLGRALSESSYNMVLLALPLLVLGMGGSPGLAGIVTGSLAAGQMTSGVVAGALVDRWNRKLILVLCEAFRAVGVGTVALVGILNSEVPAWQLVVVAFALGVCKALYEPAEDAVIPGVVSKAQLPTAVALVAARGFIAQLLGTALSGILSAAGRVMGA